jgi:hypothetical protein
VAVLLGLAFALFAYRSFDPQAERALDRSDALPEGPGLAPRPARVESTPVRSVGRWLHDRLDDLFGLTEPRKRKRSADEIGLVPSTALFGAPGGLHVRVRGSDGNLAPDVAVTVFAPPGATAPAMRRTDAGGDVRFEGLPSGPGYVVEATSVGAWFGPSPSACVGVRVEAGVARDVELALPGGPVEGRVVDEDDGKPVPNARVEVVETPTYDSGDGPLRHVFLVGSNEVSRGEAVADAEGRFRTGPLPAGPAFEFRARADDGREGSLGFVVGGVAPPVFRVPVDRPLAVTGRVVDEDDAAVADAVVRVSGTEVTTRTDADGNFSLGRVRPGCFIVEWNGTSVARIPADFDPVKAFVWLRFPRRTALAIRVVDGVGAAARDASVFLLGADDMGPDDEKRYWVFARTDAEGRARIPVMPGPVETIWVAGRAGSATFESGDDAKTPGSGVHYADLGDAFRAGDVRDLALALPLGLAVRGRAVLGGGRPAAGARVHGDDGRERGVGSRAVADDDGRFLLVGLEPARIAGEKAVLTIEAEIARVAAGKLDLSDWRPDSTAGELDAGDVVLRPGAMIRGRVVDADAAPVVGASVGGGYDRASVLTDAQGVYRLPIPSSKFVTIPVVAPGWRERELHLHGAIPSGVVRDVEPIVLRRPVAVRVRVVDLSDRPVVGARVRVARTPLDPNGKVPRTDERGVVVVAGFATWSRRLTSQDEGGFRFDLGALTDDDLSSRGVRVTFGEEFVVERELVVPEDASDPYEVVVRVPARFVLARMIREPGGSPAPQSPYRFVRRLGASRQRRSRDHAVKSRSDPVTLSVSAAAGISRVRSETDRPQGRTLVSCVAAPSPVAQPGEAPTRRASRHQMRASGHALGRRTRSRRVERISCPAILTIRNRSVDVCARASSVPRNSHRIS